MVFSEGDRSIPLSMYLFLGFVKIIRSCQETERKILPTDSSPNGSIASLMLYTKRDLSLSLSISSISRVRKDNSIMPREINSQRLRFNGAEGLDQRAQVFSPRRI